MAEEEKREENQEEIEPQVDQVRRLDFHLGSFGGVIPMLFFIIWAIIASMTGVVTTNGLSVGVVIGLIIGMYICKQDAHTYAQAVFEGFTRTIGAVAIVAWFFAGMLSEVLQVGGLVEGLIWIADATGAEQAIFTGLTFILAAIFCTAVGTGYGTAVAFGTIMYPAGIAVGADPIILAGAILSGAAFGDKLAPISDTTIVSAATQDTDVPGVVKFRLKYVIIAAIPAAVLYFIFGGAPEAAAGAAGNGDLVAEYADPSGLILLIPFALVLFLAFSGYHLIFSLSGGIILGFIMNLVLGLAPLTDMIHFNLAEGTMSGALIDGVAGYVEYAVLILLIVAASHMIQLSGAMNDLRLWLVDKIAGILWRAELAYWVLVAALNSVITINTAAEVAAAPFVKQIGREYGIHPYRRAAFLDGQTSALGYIYPWSGGLLLLVTTIAAQAEDYAFVDPVAPTSLTPVVWFGWILIVVFLIAALTGWDRKFEGPEGPMGPTVDKPYYGRLAEKQAGKEETEKE